GLLLRRALLGGVRDRGDPARPDVGRHRRARLLHPDRHRDRAAHRGGGELVSSDDPRLPARWRSLHRHQGQPGHAARSPRGEGALPPAAQVEMSQDLTIFLVLRAFASGCAALTGVEAVSDGVPAFRAPEARNARIVLAWLGTILVLLFMGITFLARHYQVTPRAEETVVSQLARLIFGGGLLYYEIQVV